MYFLKNHLMKAHLGRNMLIDKQKICVTVVSPFLLMRQALNTLNTPDKTVEYRMNRFHHLLRTEEEVQTEDGKSISDSKQSSKNK
jgi:hypothetical protein